MKRGRDTPAMAPPPSVTKKGSVSLASTQERVAYSLVTQAVQEKYGRCTLELFCARHKATRKINPLALGYKRDCFQRFSDGWRKATSHITLHLTSHIFLHLYITKSELFFFKKSKKCAETFLTHRRTSVRAVPCVRQGWLHLPTSQNVVTSTFLHLS